MIDIIGLAQWLVAIITKGVFVSFYLLVIRWIVDEGQLP